MPTAKQVFIFFIRFVKVISVLALLLFGVACGMMAKNAVESNLTNQVKSFNVLSQVGYMAFVILLVLAEFGFKWFDRLFYAFHFWIGRGLFLGWIGIQAINQGQQIVAVLDGSQTAIDSNTLNHITQTVGYTLISIGLLYLVMQMLCLQRFLGTESLEELDSGFSNINVASSGETGGGASAKYAASSGSGDLGAPLNSGSGAGRTTSLDDDDIKLLQNAASALGMTVRELRNRFSGPQGGREADKFFQQQQAKIAAGVQAAAAQEQPESRKRGATQANRSAPQGERPVAQESAVDRRQSVAQPASPSAPPDSVFRDTDNVRRRGGDDDEDLEALYYARPAEQ